MCARVFGKAFENNALKPKSFISRRPFNQGAEATRVSATSTYLEGWVGDDCNSNVYVTADLYIIIIAAGIALLCALVAIVVGRALALRSAARANARRIEQQESSESRRLLDDNVD